MFKFDVWTRIKGVDEPVSVLLSPEAFTKYEKILKLVNLPFDIAVENIQEYTSFFF